MSADDVPDEIRECDGFDDCDCRGNPLVLAACSKEPVVTRSKAYVSFPEKN